MASSLISLNVDGWKELADQLEKLGNDADIKNTEKSALMEVAQPAAEYARSLARKKSGKMAKSINVSSKLTRAQQRYRIKTGPLEAAVYFGPSTSNAHLEEFGTRERHWRKKRHPGKSTGSAAPFPFMRPAWELFKGQMLTNFGKILGAQIEKSAARLARRQAKLIAQSKS